ncbi:MAG: outer membrane protein TolC [Verrucomicrobiales bacterium]|jgi:outer membrane protein TolC
MAAVSAGMAVSLTSCIPSLYSARADGEVYRILEKVRAEHKLAMGREGEEFSIDTEDSDKKPKKISAHDVLIERSNWDKKVLTIKEAIDLGRSTSREYQSGKEDLYLAGLNYTSERHRFRPQFLASSTGTRTWIPEVRTIERTVEVPITPVPTPAPTPMTTDATAAADAMMAAAAVVPVPTTETITITEEQRFWDKRGTVTSRVGATQALATGADIGINLVNDLLRFYTGDPRKAATSTIQANILQPLLRGAAPGVATEQLRQASRDVVYEARDFAHFQLTFSADVVIEYFRLLQQKDTVYNQYNNYLARVKTTEYLEARSADRESLLDVKQAEQADLEAKNAYIDAVVRFRSALDNFKLTLGLPQTTDLRLSSEEMDALEESELVPFYLDPDQGFELALKHRLPMKNEIDRFEDSRRLVRVTADALKPGLDFFADASITSEGPLNYRDFNVRDLNANVGLALDLPINRKLERNAYRASLIRFQQQLRSLSLTFDQLRNSIDQGIRELQQFRQNYIIQKGAVTLAETRVEGAQLNLEAGEAILRDLQDAQDSLISAQNQRTTALVDYMEARLSLLIELGILNPEIEDYWISPKASIINVSIPPAGALPDSFLQGDEVISPDELFPED